MCELVIDKSASLMNKLNRKEEKWSLCATPEVTDTGVDNIGVIYSYYKNCNLTNLVHCDKNDSNYDKRGYISQFL